MKAVLVREVGTFELVDLPKPRPGPGEVLVEVAVAGLCRTDLKIIEVGHCDLVLPRIPAEEVVGTICETDLGVPRDLLGRRVYIYPGTSCGRCPPCQKGAGNLCVSMQIMGFHRDGGFAEYVTAPLESLIEIPDDTPFEDAVFAEPLSCCLNGLEQAGLRDGESITIWGGGPAGTLLKRAAEALRLHPTVVEPDDRRRVLVEGRSQVPETCFDVAIVAVGSEIAYREALEHLGPRGRLVVFSGLAPEVESQSINLNQLHYREQTIVGAYGCSYRHGQEAMQWIADGRIEVSDLVSHRFSLDQLEEALGLVKRREGMKILLYPSANK